MHRYEAAILKVLKQKKERSIEQIAAESGIGKDETLWAIENLSKQNMVEVNKEQSFSVSLSSEGKKYATDMLPEELLLKKLRSKELKAGELSDHERIGLQWCLKKKLAIVNEGMIHITEKGKTQKLPMTEGETLLALSMNPAEYEKLLSNRKPELDELSKRGLITIKEKTKVTGIRITEKGMKEDTTISVGIVDALTKEMITTRSWDGKEFKKYDVTIPVEAESPAMRHPLRRMISKIKQTYSSMGFTEISGPIVEPSFWVFDSLFVPQDHPAREAQDTFHVSNPEFIEVEGNEYTQAIRKAHTKSWKSEWKQKEADRTVLRTHTTSASARYISGLVKRIAESEVNPPFPIKLFSVGRTFRNENIDYKHLADFYQMDGLIIGKNLTMANLFDTLINFYASFNLKVKFKPAYFPFVEPGAEVFGYYDRTKDWVELCGSGIIRSEVTTVDRKKLSILAWGGGVERLLLLKDPSISSINELYGSGTGWLKSRTL